MFEFAVSSLKKAPRRRAMTQAEKNRKLAELMIVEFAQRHSCSIDVLEGLAQQAGLSGRIELQLGAGVGGRGGMELFRTSTHVIANRNNLGRLVMDFVGKDRAIELLEQANISVNEFIEWVHSLPSAE